MLCATYFCNAFFHNAPVHYKKNAIPYCTEHQKLMTFFCNAPAHYEKLAHYEKMGTLQKYMGHYKINWYPKPPNWYPKPQTRTTAISGLSWTSQKCRYDIILRIQTTIKTTILQYRLIFRALANQPLLPDFRGVQCGWSQTKTNPKWAQIRTNGNQLHMWFFVVMHSAALFHPGFGI